MDCSLKIDAKKDGIGLDIFWFKLFLTGKLLVLKIISCSFHTKGIQKKLYGRKCPNHLRRICAEC